MPILNSVDKQVVDVAILGAGPAGCVAAAELGKSGHTVALIESGQAHNAHHIESFPQSGAALAEATGLLSAICGTAYAPAQSMNMFWRQQAEIRDFGDAGPLLLHRRELHEALLSNALSISSETKLINARVRNHQRVGGVSVIVTDTATVTARLTIEARGRVEARRNNKLANRPRRDELVALPFSARLPHANVTSMCIEACREAWIWAACTPDGEVHGAIFQNASLLAGYRQDDRKAYAQACLNQCDSLPGPIIKLRTCKPTAAGFDALDDPLIDDNYFAIGDAALARDPVASHGLVHALRSGVQAAAIARTLLSPKQQSDAAIAFLRQKHRDAYRNAQTATMRAYADQARFDTDFWRSFPSPIEPSKAPSFKLSQVLKLSEPLTQAPVLDSDYVRWAPAISLPLKHDFAVQVGPVFATDIAAACQTAAILPELAARLHQVHGRKTVADAFDVLLAGGALRPA